VLVFQALKEFSKTFDGSCSPRRTSSFPQPFHCRGDFSDNQTACHVFDGFFLGPAASSFSIQFGTCGAARASSRDMTVPCYACRGRHRYAPLPHCVLETFHSCRASETGHGENERSHVAHTDDRVPFVGRCGTFSSAVARVCGVPQNQTRDDSVSFTTDPLVEAHSFSHWGDMRGAKRRNSEETGIPR